MPSLIRLIVLAAVLFGAVYGGAFFVTKYYEPEPREVKQEIYDFKVQRVQ